MSVEVKKNQLFKISFFLLIWYTFDVVNASDSVSNPGKYSWICEDGKCEKRSALDQSTITSFNVCMLLCGPSIIWPLPNSYTVKGNVVNIDSYSVKCLQDIENHKMKLMILEAENIFIDRVEKEKSQSSKELTKGTHTLEVQLEINDIKHDVLRLSTDESYSLTVYEIDKLIFAKIKGETFFGVRHGLETLAQLIVYDTVRNGLVIPNFIEINDKPAYPYRGILLDTSRNYFSVDSIKRTLDAMAINKLNTFHWHITDSQSFPLLLDNFKQFAEYGSYSKRKVYTEKDVKTLVNYAMVRGIRIVPELDTPAHIGEGWQWTPAGTTICVNKEPWRLYCYEPPCGQLNPLSNDAYNILGELYKDFIRLFKPDLYHMGGDEVHFGCWNSSEEIQSWISNYQSKAAEPVVANNKVLAGQNKNEIQEQSVNEGHLALWRIFHEKNLLKFNEACKEANHKADTILWSSNLTKGENLKHLKNTDYIIQVWTKSDDNTIQELLDANFRIILSNYDALYFNAGFGNWLSKTSDSIYYPWHTVYDNKIRSIENLPEDMRNQVLGQEAALWTEMASEDSLDAKLWPRASAMAEQLWTKPQSDWRKAESRMLYLRQRLERLGIGADAIEPEWCLQNRGGCS